MTKSIKRLLTSAFLGAALMVSAGAGAWAQQVEELGSSGAWYAWKGSDANGVICYISSQPEDAQPTNVNRDPIHFLVIHRKGLGTRNEVQTLVGYPLENNSTPEVTVDGRAFDMVVDGEAAWLASSSDQDSFVAAMKAGRQMVVKARSQRGTNTTDTYSLSGVTAMMAKIDEACS